MLYLSNACRACQDGVLLEYPEFKKYDDRWFVVGRVPATESGSGDWVANLQGGVAWSSVDYYLVFDSRDDYMHRMGQANKVPLLRRLFG